MSFTRKLILSVTFLTALHARGHGEDRPGPHGGVIRMPGAFHTEVIARPSSFLVYLLDLQFKNPVIKDSEVRAMIRPGDARLTCRANKDHFQCDLPPGIAMRGELVIEAQRAEQKSSQPAKYPLPLVVPKGGHHH